MKNTFFKRFLVSLLSIGVVMSSFVQVGAEEIEETEYIEEIEGIEETESIEETTIAEEVVVEEAEYIEETEYVEDAEGIEETEASNIEESNDDAADVETIDNEIVVEDIVNDEVVSTVSGHRLYDNLNSYEKSIYNTFYNQIYKLAYGEASSSNTWLTVDFAGMYKTTSTGNAMYYASDLGMDEITFYDDGGLTEESMQAVYDLFYFDVDKIMLALEYDLPFELYWYNGYNKDFNINLESFYSKKRGESNIKFHDTELTVKCYVKSFYQGRSNNTKQVDLLNANKTSTAKNYKANADAIIASNSAKTDAEKIDAYRDTILSLASFNDTGEFGGDNYLCDSTEMLSIFDKDTDSTSVSSAYAKAFQYLCDNTTFSSDIYCYTVTGVVGEIGSNPMDISNISNKQNHTWNIIRYNNTYYLFDLANMDEGRPGYKGQMMDRKNAMSGSVKNGYTIFLVGNQYLLYTYDTNTKMIYNTSDITLNTYMGDIPVVEECEEHVDENEDLYCDVCGKVAVEFGAMKGYSLSIEDNIGVNFYMAINDEALNDKDATMEFNINGRKNSIKLSDATPTTIDEKTYYVFKVNVAPKDFETEIKTYLSYGGNKTQVQSFKMVNYITYILEKLDDKMLSANTITKYKKGLEENKDFLDIFGDDIDAYMYVLAGNLLRYCQDSKNYLVNNDIGFVDDNSKNSDDTYYKLTDNIYFNGYYDSYTDDFISGADNDDNHIVSSNLKELEVELYASSLIVDSKINLRLYFKITGTEKATVTERVKVEETVNGKTENYLLQKYDEANSIYYVDLASIANYDYDALLNGNNVKVKYDNGESITYKYSVADYCSLIDEMFGRSNFVNSMVAYYKAANSYYSVENK